jgi:hypothetical protein
MTTLGVDVSLWQGTTLDWSKIDLAGVDFAVAKATEGTAIVDPTYAVNLAHIRSTTLVPGSYAWLTPNADQVKAVTLFIDTVNAHGGGLAGQLVALDIEQPGCTPGMIRAWAAAFKRRAPGHPLFLYIGRNVISDMGYPRLADIGPWWEPLYPGGPGYPGDASPVWRTGLAGWKAPTIWQYGQRAAPTAPGPVDSDAFLGTADELRAYTGATMKTPLTDATPKMVQLSVGDQIYNPDGTPLVKVSVAGPARLSSYGVTIGGRPARVIPVSTGGVSYLGAVLNSAVTITPAPPSASADEVAAATKAGYNAGIDATVKQAATTPRK